jgi:hypothetical protein
MLTNDHKEVNFTILTSVYIGYPSKLIIYMVCYLLVLDINVLLYDSKHVSYAKTWNLLILTKRWGTNNKPTSAHV